MKYDKARVEYLLSKEKSESVVSELVQRNRGLVYRQLSRMHLAYDQEAVSLGYEALYNAIMTYDYKKNRAFSTYASVCIYNTLGSYIRSLKSHMNNNVVSYETPIDSTGRTLMDTLESPVYADSNILEEEGVAYIRKTVEDIVNSTTNYTHRCIISEWAASGYKLKQREIADKVGCSQTYVSQAIGEFKAKLKKKLEEYQNE